MKTIDAARARGKTPPVDWQSRFFELERGIRELSYMASILSEMAEDGSWNSDVLAFVTLEVDRRATDLHQLYHEIYALGGAA